MTPFSLESLEQLVDLGWIGLDLLDGVLFWCGIEADCNKLFRNEKTNLLYLQSDAINILTHTKEIIPCV